VEIGKIIKENRTAKNMTQEELANHLFVSRPLISKWENGRSYPDLEQLLKLSDFFDLTLDELMRGDKKMTNILNLNSKKKKIMTVIIFCLLLIIGITVYYSYWTQRFIQLKPEDINILSIETIEVPEKKRFNNQLNKDEIIPGDIAYKIKFNSNKKFVTINNVYVEEKIAINDPNIYIHIQAVNTLFKSSNSEELIIPAKMGEISEGEKTEYFRNTDKSIYLLDTKQFNHLNKSMNKELLLQNISWKLIDKKELNNSN